MSPTATDLDHVIEAEDGHIEARFYGLDLTPNDDFLNLEDAQNG